MPQKAFFTQERNHQTIVDKWAKVSSTPAHQGRQSLLFELKPVKEEVDQRIFPGEVESGRGQYSDHLFSFVCNIYNEEYDESLHDWLMTVAKIWIKEVGRRRIMMNMTNCNYCFSTSFIVREGVNEKKNVFFRALPESPKPPPPMTQIRATWSSFFGSRNSRFENQFRT